MSESEIESGRVINKSTITERRRHHVPLLGTFYDRVQAVLTDDVESCWNVEPHLRALLDTDVLKQFLHHELSVLRDDPNHALPNTNDKGMELIATDRWRLLLGFYTSAYNPSPKALLCSNDHVLMTVVGEGRLGVQIYKQLSPQPNDLFDRTKRLTPTPPIELDRHQVLRMRGGEDAPRILPVAGSVLTLSFAMHRVVPLIWAYDAETLMPMKAYSGDLTCSRIEFATQILSAFGARDALPVLASLQQHPAHFVRWTALRHAMRLDPQAAVTLLEAACNDPHPHVSHAARQSIERYRAFVAAAPHT